MKNSVKKISIITLLICFILSPFEFSINRETKNVEVTLSAAQAATQLTAPTVSLKTTSDNNVKISWGKIKNASKYEIYRATSSSGKYTKIKSVTKLYYTDKTVKAGKTYYYKVKALPKSSKYSKSKYSKVKKIKIPKKAADLPDSDEPAKEECVHKYGDWIITKQETNLESGEKYRECKNCGNKEIVEIPPKWDKQLISEYNALLNEYLSEKDELVTKINGCYAEIAEATKQKTDAEKELMLLSPNISEEWLIDYISRHINEYGDANLTYEMAIYTHYIEYTKKKTELELTIQRCDLTIDSNNTLVSQYNSALAAITRTYTTNVNQLGTRYGIINLYSSLAQQLSSKN